MNQQERWDSNDAVTTRPIVLALVLAGCSLGLELDEPGIDSGLPDGTTDAFRPPVDAHADAPVDSHHDPDLALPSDGSPPGDVPAVADAACVRETCNGADDD